MVEWSNTAVLKTAEVRASGGSNPSLCATDCNSIFCELFFIQKNKSRLSIGCNLNPFKTYVLWGPRLSLISRHVHVGAVIFKCDFFVLREVFEPKGLSLSVGPKCRIISLVGLHAQSQTCWKDAPLTPFRNKCSWGPRCPTANKFLWEPLLPFAC